MLIGAPWLGCMQMGTWSCKKILMSSNWNSLVDGFKFQPKSKYHNNQKNKLFSKFHVLNCQCIIDIRGLIFEKGI